MVLNNGHPYDSSAYSRDEKTGWFLFGLGLGVAVTAPYICFPIAGRWRYVSAYYTPEDADEWIRQYNDDLGEELGLDPADVKRLDLQSRRPRLHMAPYLVLGGVGIAGRF